MPEAAFHEAEAIAQDVEWVMMYHPATGGEARVAKEAFESTWSDNGWTLTPPKAKSSAKET